MQQPPASAIDNQVNYAGQRNLGRRSKYIYNCLFAYKLGVSMDPAKSHLVVVYLSLEKLNLISHKTMITVALLLWNDECIDD